MILSIPVRRAVIRRSDGQAVEAYELIPGFVRATSENTSDHDAQNGGHILLSNPLIEWTIDQVNRTNIGTAERVYIHLHTQAPSNEDGTQLSDITENVSFV